MIYAPGTSLPDYRIRAFNSASDSNNLIHEDRHARRYGFRAGLVPGVSIYAYWTHPLVQMLGTEWLHRGTADVRFVHPVYEGEEVRVTGVVAAVGADGSVTVECQASNPSGVTCCAGTAGLAPMQDAPAPAPEDFPAGTAPLLRPITLATLEVGELLTPIQSQFTWQINWEYCQKTVHDHLEVYRKCGHPGWLLAQANRILSANYDLPPWIHVSSVVRSFRAQTEEAIVETRGRVADRFERKGHHFVVIEVGVFGPEGCLITAKHTAIFRIAPHAA